MLGGWKEWTDRATGKSKDGPKEKWRPDMAVVRAVIAFAKETGRLSTDV